MNIITKPFDQGRWSSLPNKGLELAVGGLVQVAQVLRRINRECWNASCL